jgi:hypothetical protein
MLSFTDWRKWDHLKQYLLNFEEAYQHHDFLAASNHFTAALANEPAHAFRFFVSRVSGQLATSLLHANRIAEVSTRLDSLFTEHPRINDMGGNLFSVARRSRNIAKSLPSVALVTQGKSASLSVSAIFNAGLGLRTVAYSLIQLDVIDSWARDFARGGACYTTHLDPTPHNINLLAKYRVKTVVHVRDPRQALLSLAHHVDRYPEQGPAFGSATNELHPIERVEALMAHYRSSLKWIAGWLQAEPRLDIMFSTFEDFVIDRQGFIDRYLDFYGAGQKQFSYRKAVHARWGTDYHFRRGEIDEWRRVLPQDTVSRLNDAMPPALADRFGWTF